MPGPRSVKKRKLSERPSSCDQGHKKAASWPRHSADSAGEAGNGRDGASVTLAETMIKAKTSFAGDGVEAAASPDNCGFCRWYSRESQSRQFEMMPTGGRAGEGGGQV